MVMGADFLRRSLSKLEGMAPEKRVVEGVLRSAARLTSLIADLQDYGQLQTGQFEVEKQPVDVAKLVASSIDAHATLAADKSIALNSASAPTTPLSGDEERILQALAKLLTNALRHSPQGGVVRLEVRVDAGRATFSVLDDGAGMSAEQSDHAFDPAWHASQSPRHGTGLGLALVKGIAEAHGGDASVETRPEGGMRASFWIPAAS